MACCCFVVNGTTGIPIKDIVKNILPYLVSLLASLMLLILFPELVLWLPRYFGYSGHMIRLGLIGDNIKASRAPKLHRLCGQMCGVDVSYELLIPAEQGLEFEPLFDRCRAGGYRGLNITLPYKVRVMPKLVIADERVRQIGAVNTVVFDGGRCVWIQH